MLNIEYIKPKNYQLSKHINYYYFVESNKSESHSFTHFPHYRTTLNVYLNACIEIKNSNMTLNHKQNEVIKTVLNNNKFLSKSVTINGKHNIIGIVFKPLGINNFTKTNLNILTQDSEFFPTDIWKGFIKKMTCVFEKQLSSEKGKLLDDFFLEIYEPFKNNTLEEMTKLIITQKGAISVNEMEQQFCTSRRSILRLFKKHLCCSIIDFKRTVKFRNSLDSYQKKEIINLTNLSLDNNYYDQSDFINQFKLITGNIPSKVLYKINQMGQKDIFWLLNN